MAMVNTKQALLAAILGTFSAQHLQASVILGDIDITGSGSTDATILNSSGETIVVDPSNNGDIRFTVDGITPKQSEGVLLAYSTEAGIAGFPRQQIATVGDVTTNVPGFADYWVATHNISSAGSETRFDFALAYFPFADGWVSGTIDAAGNTVAGTGSGYTLTKRTGTGVNAGNYNLQVTGVDSATDGYLFTIAASNETSGNYTMTRQASNGGWDIAVMDQGNDASNGTAGEDDTFSFVYIPETAPNLTAGLIDDNGSTLKSTGSFTVTTNDAGLSIALGTGEYFLQISDGNGGFLGREDGVLMLNVEKDAVSTFDGPDDNFLLHDYIAADEGFRVSSYDLGGADPQTTEWAFAFIQFDNPILVPEPSSLALLAAGGLLIAKRRRRSA